MKRIILLFITMLTFGMLFGCSGNFRKSAAGSESPQITFPLKHYQMTMSSVPGFPMKITSKNANKIHQSTSGGELLLWSGGKVQKKGKELDIITGDTVYWSPLSGVAEKNCTILVKAVYKNKETGYRSVVISTDKSGDYTGRIS